MREQKRNLISYITGFRMIRTLGSKMRMIQTSVRLNKSFKSFEVEPLPASLSRLKMYWVISALMPVVWCTFNYSRTTFKYGIILPNTRNLPYDYRVPLNE